MLQPRKPVKVVEKKTTVTTKKKTKPNFPADEYKNMPGIGTSVGGGEGTRPPFGPDKKGDRYYNLDTKKYETVKKNGGAMKKAKSGLGMKSVKSGYDNNSGVTRADFVAIGKGTAKSGAKMKMGGKMAKQAAVAIAMKKAGKKPKKAQMGNTIMADPMMKSGGKMKKCKYGCK